MAGKHRFRQSVAYWCLALTEWKWDIETICQSAKELGIESVELTPPELYPMLRKHGLQCALAPNGMPDPPFAKGLNNLKYHEQIFTATRNAIDACAEFGWPNVIAFTGYKWLNAEDPASGQISPQQGAANCVKGLKEFASYAGPRGVTVCLEHLNSRDGSHPMKGHPGYQGDDLDFCANIVRQVGSPHVRLLFDIYHVQVMNGDVIRRIHQNSDVIGHVHTAGNPGRCELDDRQELRYEPIIAALQEIGYEGFIGHEFIPTRNPYNGLAEAVRLCQP